MNELAAAAAELADTERAAAGCRAAQLEHLDRWPRYSEAATCCTLPAPLHLLPPQLAPQPAAPTSPARAATRCTLPARAKPAALSHFAATRCTLPAHTPSAPPPPWTATAIVAMERTLTTGLSSAGRLRACVDRDKASAWPRIQRQAIEDGTECVRLRRARPPPATALLSACHQHVLSAAKRYSTPHPDERVAKAVAVAVELRPWASKGACNA
jgi:hypothetical protein